ncbi:MAG: hypothetical protein ACREQW_07230, partial [Candidatus Binatia bacterium]
TRLFTSPFEKREAVKKLKPGVGWVEPFDFAQDRLRDTHRLELRSVMGIGAQRLNPPYKRLDSFTPSGGKRGICEIFKPTNGQKG